MPMKIRIEHDGKGWMEIWKSDGMQAVVDQAGERIAAEAGEPYYGYMAKPGRSTAGGFVSSMTTKAAIYQQKYKLLSRAVHR